MTRKYTDLISTRTAEILIAPDGSARLRVFDPDGSITVDRPYKTEGIAYSTMTRRLCKDGLWVRTYMNDAARAVAIDRIFRFLHDYSAHTYSLPRVVQELLAYLDSLGYDVDLTDGKHRDYRTVYVDGRTFRIFRHKGWSFYQVY